VHDEIVQEVDDDKVEEARQNLIDVMCTPPAWAEGLPLDVEATIMSRYGKG
jgi:DNA polymerase I-like protein with 3'-5' exonuclease and polymerase domains